MITADRLEWGLIPAVPVPFRGHELADDALRGYARWMAGQPIAGVAVWAHTGRGPHLSDAQRRRAQHRRERRRERLPGLSRDRTVHGHDGEHCRRLG